MPLGSTSGGEHDADGSHPDPENVAAPSLVGQVLGGKYRIEAFIGAGGMGAVFKATQLTLDRPVAIKIMRSSASEAVNAERFKREALAVAQLSHANVVTVYDYDVEPGVGAYLVTEFLDGRSLRAELARTGKLVVRDAVAILEQACAGVQAAHDAGIVHRDIKPENVFLVGAPGSPLRAKVLDFGIAKIVALRDDLKITQEGTFVGSARYSSPEQADGFDVDGRADVYSLGCVLYEMLAGRPPFVATTVASLIVKHAVERPKSLHHFRLDVSPSVQSVVDRSLAKRAEDRYPTPASLADALVRALQTETGVHEIVGQITHDTPPGDPTAENLRVTGESHRRPPRADGPRNNLPVYLANFVERETEREAIRRLLASTRLVSLTGAGGIGKTRLAVEIARDMLDEYPDGVWFVELGPLADLNAVPQVVASALGVREEGGTPIVELVVEALARKRALLVLDNCEHLVASCAELVRMLLGACPELRVLATSREALRLTGEALYHVPSLSHPAADAPLEEALGYQAVQLFVERARALVPAFELTAANVAAVASICRRLEGIPLAIELAAARSRVLTPAGIDGRLGDRFRLLTGGERGSPTRQQTLRAAVDWGYELLTDEERVLLQRLSVFSGGWSVDGAESVGRGEEWGGGTGAGVERGGAGSIQSSHSPLPTLDILERLVDKSMVRVDESGVETRFAMLDTIREYAREKLRGAGQEAVVSGLHAAWCLAIAAVADEATGEDEKRDAYEVLEREHENLRAALHWSIDREGDVRFGVSLCDRLYRYWIERGYLSEGRRWFTSALARDPELPRATAATTVRQLCTFAVSQGDYQEARTILETSLESPEGVDEREVTMTLHLLAHVEERMGDYERAERSRERSLAIARKIEDLHAIGITLNSLGLAALDRGEYPRAAQFFVESLSVFRERGEMPNIAVALHNLGEIAFRLGDADRAVELLEESLAIGREYNLKRVIAYSSHVLGNVSTDTGDLARARALFREAMALNEEVGDRDGVAYVLEGLACLAAAEGDAERALRLASAAASARASIGSTLPPPEKAAFDDRMERVRATLDPDRAERAVAEGWAMSLREAASEAERGD
jgi:predicted ATPase/serine/threonine protein kinase/Tfp pilus assembly protein PilF